MKLIQIHTAIFIIILSFSPLPSYAENWVEYYFHTTTNKDTGDTMSAIESFYDSDSLRFINDDTFKVWIKQSTQHNGEISKYLGKGHESKKLLIINCRTQMFEVVSGGVDTSKMPSDMRAIIENLNRGHLDTSLAFKELAVAICSNRNSNNDNK